MEITLKLSLEYAKDIANVLGTLPVHSNAHPVWKEVCKQIDEQVKAEAQTEG